MTSHTTPEIVELDAEQLEALLGRMEAGQLTPEDVETLAAALKSYLYVTQLIDQKSTSIARLRKLLFGAQTEKTAAVTGRDQESTPADPHTTSGSIEEPAESGGRVGPGAFAPRPLTEPDLWVTHPALWVCVSQVKQQSLTRGQ